MSHPFTHSVGRSAYELTEMLQILELGWDGLGRLLTLSTSDEKHEDASVIRLDDRRNNNGRYRVTTRHHPRFELPFSV